MAEEIKANGAADAAEQQAPQFAIQRVYTKDISFETPNTPEIFKKEWKPDTKLDIDTRSTKIADDTYEVVLSVTVTVKVEEEIAFLGEVKQAGIFSVGEMPEQAKAHTLGAFCPNLLFPYAREVVSSLAARGSFPALNLAPVNFDAIFAAYVQKRAEEAKGQTEAATADA